VAEPLIRRWDVRLDRDEVLESLRPGDFSSVVAACHRAYARSKRKTHWGNLDIATLDYMDRVNAWFPTARFLHIVRDGRDVALSHRTMPYGATNAVDCALAWRHRLHANLKMGAMVGMERYRVVRYEDLIQDPERTLEGICHFLGIEYCSDMLRYPEMVREKIPEDRRWLWPAIDQPPDQGKIERWRREMSSSARLSFEAEAGDVLRKLGYPCPELVPRTLGRFGYEAWCFADRGGRFRRLGTRLGIQRASALERQAIFVTWRNYVKVLNEKRPRKSPTAAMMLSLTRRPLTVEDVLHRRAFPSRRAAGDVASRLLVRGRGEADPERPATPAQERGLSELGRPAGRVTEP